MTEAVESFQMGSFEMVFLILAMNPEWLPLPETNIAPENGWLEDEFPFGMA